MASTTNYNWDTPDNSGLVKNGAQDIRTLGSAIDTSVWNVGFGQAGKNKIINGDLSVNQRAFSSITTTQYTFDRWRAGISGDGTSTYSAQTFALGAAPVAGYESKNFIQIATTGQTSAAVLTKFEQRMENVRTFAGQTITVSFWAKAATGTPKIALEVQQYFGTGGSPSAIVNTYGGQATISTAWARYSLTVAVPSISGKTIGTDANSDWFSIEFFTSAGTDFNARSGSLGIQTATISMWGMQVEYGSKATPFQTASGGSLQGEMAMCQRYLPVAYAGMWQGFMANTTNGRVSIPYIVTPRVTPTGITISALSNYYVQNFALAASAPTSLTFSYAGTSTAILDFIVTAGSPTLVAGQSVQFGVSSSNILFTGCEL
jgi:hypothetical protein